jgi:hypothetical protein
MKGSAWIALLRRIPPELHSSLGLGLVTGGEVVVQQLIRLEEDFVVVRGRMAGSTAEGRVMAVPYSHMTLIALNKRMNEPEVQKLFGKTMPTAPLITEDGPLETRAPAEPMPPAAEPIAPAPAPIIAADASKAKTVPPSKSMLLARLRERLAEKPK